MAKYKSPEMVWTSQDLSHEWRRFYRQASCILDGPLHDKEENVKVSYLKMWVGDKGLDVFKGFVQFLSRYLPSLSTVDAPLRDLEKEDMLFHWDPPQQESFEKITKLVSEAPVLQYYNVLRPAKIQCDASGKGLGAVLLQDDKPVCYASRTLTGAESRYAPIEAEMLAVVFACRKFHQYIYGKSVVVETDHKPLQAISTKPLSQAPLRLQRMLLNLRGYDVEIRYNPGCKHTEPSSCANWGQ